MQIQTKKTLNSNYRPLNLVQKVSQFRVKDGGMASIGCPDDDLADVVLSRVCLFLITNSPMLIIVFMRLCP